MEDRMGKISDELRERGNGYYEQRNGDCEWFNAIADRIDAEMVELPKSADGKTWTGREVCFWVEAGGGAWALHSLRSLDLIDGSRWYVRDTGRLGYEAGAAWHERPDSWERIAGELDEMVDAASNADDTCERLADLADRIRKLAKEQTNE